MHFSRIRDLIIIFLMKSKHRTRIQRQQCLHKRGEKGGVTYIFEIVDRDVGFGKDGPGSVFRGIGVDSGFG